MANFWFQIRYASEILSILVQNSKDNQILVGKLNGIDTLLSAVAVSTLKFLVRYQYY